MDISISPHRRIPHASLGNKIQPQVFLTEVFLNFPGVMDVSAFGSWKSAPKCLFFQDYEGLTEIFAPGRPPGYPRGRPLGYPAPKLTLWTAFFVPAKLYWQAIVARNLVVLFQGVGCHISVTVRLPVRRDNVLGTRCKYPPPPTATRLKRRFFEKA